MCKRVPTRGRSIPYNRKKQPKVLPHSIRSFSGAKERQQRAQTEEKEHGRSMGAWWPAYGNNVTAQTAQTSQVHPVTT